MRPGKIGFLNNPDSNLRDESCSGFFITLEPMPSLKNKFMIVGEVIDGLDELKSALYDNSEVGELKVEDCGEGQGVFLKQAEYIW